MKITYTGRADALTPPQLKKLEGKFAKLAKLLDMKLGEREAHVILTAERHLQQAEITVRFHYHNLVGIGGGADVFLAVSNAVGRLEKQVLKLREKRRDTQRGAKGQWAEEETPAEAAVELAAEGEGAALPERRIFRVVNNHAGRKPMTLEEALLAMEQDRDYVVYRDAETDRFSVLVRRQDGNFDLIEA
ncbi:MAG: HPF/RaiA family ribosome-associated protein [Acidobacteriota bacterium]